MRSTEELVQEHRLIETVLDALARRLEDTRRTGTLHVPFLRKLVVFSTTFVDKCHHRKEEGCLFPCLEGSGIPSDGGPIGMMLMEHEMGRTLVGRISENLDLYEKGNASVDDVAGPCQEYLELLGQHILKENNVLYPLGESVMSEQDDTQNLGCYEDREEEIGAETREDLIRLAEEMAAGR
jgi:hemerythrin-like domain-containing protein